jgi:hypothetical protein
MAYPIGVTKSLGSWNFQRHHVERMLDNSAYEAAHPDDTLILAGPARKGVVRPQRSSTRTLMALGMFLNFSVQTSVPLTPVMAIGSGRSFFLRGKSQSRWQVNRCLINGRNLLRALYHNAVEAGIQVDRFDDPAAFEGQPDSQAFLNLDSELFYIPFGMAVIVKSKSHTSIMSFYLELCMIDSWGAQITSGGNMIAEAVSGMCDRVLPYQATDSMENPEVGRNLMDAVLGLANDVFPTPISNRVGGFPDAALGDPTVASLP